MKHCPECNRNYADPTLSFCLQDGFPNRCFIQREESAFTNFIRSETETSGGSTINI
jgi:hypothetical protein